MRRAATDLGPKNASRSPCPRGGGRRTSFRLVCRVLRRLGHVAVEVVGQDRRVPLAVDAQPHLAPQLVAIRICLINELHILRPSLAGAIAALGRMDAHTFAVTLSCVPTMILLLSASASEVGEMVM